MHSIKWLVVAELYALAIYASIGGHSTAALVLAVAASIATLVALELGAKLDDEGEQSISVERLALVLVYAWQHHNATGEPASSWWIAGCRRAAESRCDLGGRPLAAVST
jgi:hypothetical protein